MEPNSYSAYSNIEFSISYIGDDVIFPLFNVVPSNSQIQGNVNLKPDTFTTKDFDYNIDNWCNEYYLINTKGTPYKDLYPTIIYDNLDDSKSLISQLILLNMYYTEDIPMVIINDYKIDDIL